MGLKLGTMKTKMTLLAALSASTTFALASNDYISGHFGALTNQLVPNVGNVDGNRLNADWEFDFHKPNSEVGERRATFAALVNDRGLIGYSVQELYLGTNNTKNHSLKFGRFILPWSKTDAFWGFGKLNNRRNFNFFTPGQEGLIGVDYKYKHSGIRGLVLQLFASPIFVPETNPALDINKRKRTVTSRSPWADPPSRSADTGATGTKKIDYIVDYPSISRVINRYSAGMYLGWEDNHFLIDAFVIRKPENQLSTKVNVALDPANDVVKAYVSPQFYYHDVYGSNVKYKNKDLEMYFSAIAIRPNTFPDGDSEVTRLTEIKTEKRREDYVGMGISKINDDYGMGLNYVVRLSPFDRDRDSLATDPRWNQAVDIYLKKVIGQSLSLMSDLKYDMLTTDRLFMFRADYMASQTVQLNLGVNMIGTPESGKSFWSTYTNNDAVYAGMQYIY